MRQFFSGMMLASSMLTGSTAQEDKACDGACIPGKAEPKCKVGSRMSVQLGVDYRSHTDIWNRNTTSFGVCPVVDTLTGIKLTNLRADNKAAYLKVANFLTPQPVDPLADPNASEIPAAYIKIAEQNTTTSDKYVVDLVVLNVTMSNGQFVGIVNSNTSLEWDGAGFMPTCDPDGKCIDVPMDNRKCIGDVPDKMFCAKKLEPSGETQFNTRVVVIYYGSDADGKSMESGSTRPFKFSGFSRSFDPFSALRNSF